MACMPPVIHRVADDSTPSAPAFGGKDEGGAVAEGLPVCRVFADAGGPPQPCSHSCGCKPPLSLRLCGAKAQWWLFGLGFLCPLLWLVACFAPLVACTAAGVTARTAIRSRSAVVAWSLSFTFALLALILGSVAASLLVIGAGHGNGVGGSGSEWVVGGVPLGQGAPLP